MRLCSCTSRSMTGWTTWWTWWWSCSTTFSPLSTMVRSRGPSENSSRAVLSEANWALSSPVATCCSVVVKLRLRQQVAPKAGIRGQRKKPTLDLGGRDDLLLDVLGAVLGVEDRLDVVLDVVNCANTRSEVSYKAKNISKMRRSTNRDGQPRAGAQPPRPRGPGASRLR